MKYGFVLTTGDPRAAAELAQVAEQAGWDGFFVFDAPWHQDPWVMLAAAAMTTERIRLGTMLTGVPRRRPWKLASETATLDNLSGGRVILTAGLGAPETGLPELGEAVDRRTRAELLDEGLDVVAGLWAGQPFAYEGKHYTVKPMSFPAPPKPVQQPRITVWVVGAWPRQKSMRRVLKWDGIVPCGFNEKGEVRQATPDEVREIKAYVDRERGADTPFDIVVEGETPGGDLAAYADAGATWWNEARWSAPDVAALRRRLEDGPPTP